jgi:rSAM/selenodomain-associated transferase 1
MICGSKRTIHLGVMAKYWESGRVKTRLGASIGMSQAAEIHRLFCRHLANGLLGVADEQSFVITPSEYRFQFASMLPQGWSVRLQADGDLGNRIAAWFQDDCSTETAAANQGGPSEDKILIGADCPLIERELIRQTQSLLSDHDLVLGPAIDGGYYLIALRDGWRPEYMSLVCEMPWSSDRLFDLTCSRARQAGLKLATLSPMEDIDTIAELERLRTTLLEKSSHLNDSLRDSIERVLCEDVES